MGRYSLENFRVNKLGRVFARNANEYLSYYSQVVDSGCILYTGCISAKGYGRINGTMWASQHKTNSAHQLAYIVANGDYDRKLDICHTCHVRNCINPDHLYAGTRKENMADMYRAGRDRHVKGLLNGKAKLSDSEIIQIRYLIKSDYTNRYIAKLYNVSESFISNIKAGRRRNEF